MSDKLYAVPEQRSSDSLNDGVPNFKANGSSGLAAWPALENRPSLALWLTSYRKKSSWEPAFSSPEVKVTVEMPPSSSPLLHTNFRRGTSRTGHLPD